MRHEARAFLQEQALVGGGERQPPGPRFLDQMLVILRRLEAEQRQPEAVLSVGRAVAAAAVAAILREDRDDAVRKVVARILFEALDGERCRGGQRGCARDRGGDGRRAVGQRAHHALLVDGDHAGWLGGERGDAGEVERFAVGVGARHHDLLAGILATQHDAFAVGAAVVHRERHRVTFRGRCRSRCGSGGRGLVGDTDRGRQEGRQEGRQGGRHADEHR